IWRSATPPIAATARDRVWSWRRMPRRSVSRSTPAGVPLGIHGGSVRGVTRLAGRPGARGLQDRARAVSRGTANRTAGLRERLASRRSHRGTTGGSRDRPRWQPVCVGRPRRSHPPCDVRPAMKARVALAFAVVALTAATAGAEVRRVVVDAREDVLGGAYEKLKGTVELELDPTHPANTVIVDLDRAPRNARGRVDASADFMVLRPRRPPARGSVALLEVSNRGGKAVLP